MSAKNEGINAGQTLTYEEALDKTGTGKFQYFVVLVGGLIIFSSYISVGAIAYVLPAAQCDLKMDSQAKGHLASIGYVGLLMSCHLWGFLSDTLGRRYIIIRCLFADALLYVITCVTPYYPAILVLRLIHGFVSSGGVACIYAYVGEFIRDKNRTRGLMTSAMIASFAYFICPFYAWLTISGKWEFQLYPGLIFKPWRLYYAVCGIPSLTCFILMCFLPESPKFLLAKSEVLKSIEILRRINKSNGNKEEDFQVKHMTINENEKVATFGGGSNKALAFVRLMWNQTAPLFKEPHRVNIALVCLAQALIYFCNGGMYLWLPEIINRLAIFKEKTDNERASFCDVVEYVSNQNKQNVTAQTVTFNQTNVPTCSEEIDYTVYLYLGILGVIQTINLTAIITVSKKFNKKYILVQLVLLSLLSTVSIEFVHYTGFVAYGACLLIIFTGGVIPIINSVVVDLFPTNLRGMASCLTLMSCRVGTVITNIIAGSLIDKQCSEFIWCFIVVMAVCLIIVAIMPTKSQAVQEIKDSTNL